MAETVNQETEVPEHQGTTFTQGQLEAILADRLARERAKYADYDDIKSKAALYDQAQDNKQKLQQAQSELSALRAQVTARDARDKVAADTGVPAHLLTAETEETCRAQAETLLAWRGQRDNYPSLQDGGAPRAPTTTKEDIMAIPDQKARLQAIRENIQLFDK